MHRRRAWQLLALLACLLPAARALGINLPSCADVAAPQSVAAIQRCQQEAAQLQEWQQCSGAATKLCCTTLERALLRHCHCVEGVAGEQLQHWQALHSQCAQQAGRLASQDAPPGVRLFVGVLTAGMNRQARQAVRDTWGSDPRLHRVLFFAAKPREPRVFEDLRLEAARTGDIVLLPTIWESYFNITHQTLEVLRVAALDREATHVLKADDDSYVRVGGVLDRIAQAPAERLLLGFVENPGGGPHRDPASQWYASPEEWPSERYPPWAHGAGYVISQDLVREIAAGGALLAQDHAIFKLEDIAVGSWIEAVAAERRWAVNYVADAAFNYNGCGAYDVVSHYVKPRAMRCMFRADGRCCSPAALRKSGARLRGGGGGTGDG